MSTDAEQFATMLARIPEEVLRDDPFLWDLLLLSLEEDLAVRAEVVERVKAHARELAEAPVPTLDDLF